MKKKLYALMALMLIFALMMTACAKTEEAGEKPAEKTPSIALLLPGPINDMGWNASAFNGLKAIEKEYGAKISYSENVAQSDMEDVFNNYAEIGFDIVVGHGSQFQDACLAAAAKYPDTQFILINGSASKENVASIQIADDQQGFLMGAFAALMSKSGKVGIIGGEEIPPITNAVKGFVAGAKYANPNVKVMSTMTGSFADVNKAKETALAFIENGADYVGAVANQAGLGSIEACADRGVYAIGANVDQYDIAPETVIVSVVKEVPVLFLYGYDNFVKGTLEGKVYRLGVKEKAIYFSDYHDHADKIPQEVQDKLDQMITDLGDGKISSGI